ncbi:MAG: FAD-dependent thymidylate synthase [Bacillota bacterium]
MKVTILRHTPDPEGAVALAARLCYAEELPEDLAERLTPEATARLIERLRALGHESPFEHATFSFSISRVSRALTHQLVRHRLASYSQRSQRYVSEEAFEYVTPPKVERSPEAARIYHEAVEASRRAYASLIRVGVTREDARYLLPNACHSAIIVTMNARSLINFFRLRCCGRAQWEIRALAYRMLREACRVAPVLFNDCGPTCATQGYCPEGNMSCGRLERTRKAGVSLNGPEDCR